MMVRSLDNPDLSMRLLSGNHFWLLLEFEFVEGLRESFSLSKGM
jgi:hypothetical protein